MSASRAVAYLDSSAILKLVVTEPETDALRRHLALWERRVSSALALVEVPRAVARAGQAVEDAFTALSRLSLIAVDDARLRVAAHVAPATLRSLDAVHIASAQLLGGDLGILITYDRRMREAALLLGLPVASPGAPQA